LIYFDYILVFFVTNLFILSLFFFGYTLTLTTK